MAQEHRLADLKAIAEAGRAGQRAAHTFMESELRKAIAAVPAWQPIETAPKDGTHVLLYSPQQEYQGKPVEPRLTYGYWLVLEHGKYLGDCGGECRCPEYDDTPDPFWYSEDGGFTNENPPTHWMPLPEPPAAALKLAEGQPSGEDTTTTQEGR